MAFVSGIDLTDDGGDRFDSSAHPARRRLGWHDVGTRLRGPAVADVHDHFAGRWHEVTGERLERPGPPAPRGRRARCRSCAPSPRTCTTTFPRGDFRILESYMRALRGAQRLIYLENQFLWSPEIVAILADKLRNPPRRRLPARRRCCPPRPTTARTTRAASSACWPTADDGAGRFLAATIRSRTGERDDPLYVHAKVGIVDDRWLTVGSANLNAHSLLNDTEMNVVTDDAALARATRLRLWAEHLELDPEAVADGDPARSIDEHWRPIAAEQLERRERGAAADASPDRAARRLEALDAACSARCEGLTDDG